MLYDPDGQKILIWYEDDGGKQQSIEYTQRMEDEEENSYVTSVIEALNQLSKGNFGSQMIGYLQSSDLTYNISKGKTNTASHDFNDSKKEDGVIKTGANITWDGSKPITFFKAQNF